MMDKYKLHKQIFSIEYGDMPVGVYQVLFEWEVMWRDQACVYDGLWDY